MNSTELYIFFLCINLDFIITEESPNEWWSNSSLTPRGLQNFDCLFHHIFFIQQIYWVIFSMQFKGVFMQCDESWHWLKVSSHTFGAILAIRWVLIHWPNYYKYLNSIELDKLTGNRWMIGKQKYSHLMHLLRISIWKKKHQLQTYRTQSGDWHKTNCQNTRRKKCFVQWKQ